MLTYLFFKACPDADEVANIYVLDCKSFLITKKLSFHTRGVQKMVFTKDGSYLISVGNFRESTVAVWNFNTGKLITSSYTLDKINDIKISENTYSSERLIEFTTVGRDQIQFWALNNNEKLEYYDVFIEKKKTGELHEITAHDYIQESKREFILAGTSSGKIIINIFIFFPKFNK
jgi:WD40 repeat protein